MLETKAAVAGSESPLERFVPAFDVVERHHVRVSAPAEVTYQAALALDLRRSPVVRAIFKAREWMMRAQPAAASERPRLFLQELRELGWGVLEDDPGRAIVMGAVTEPWEANVRFRGLPPDEFEAFDEPGHVKIAWTFEVEGHGGRMSTLRTETRVVATDAEARRKFRRYWAVFSPGIVLIRKVALRLIKADAERRYAASPAVSSSAP